MHPVNYTVKYGIHVPSLPCQCTIKYMYIIYQDFRTLYYKYITPTLHVLPDMDNDSWLVCIYTTQR